MKLAVFTFTRDRLPYTQRTMASMRAKKPGYRYDHFVYDMGSTDGTPEWLDEQARLGHITSVIHCGENLGQHVGGNRAHAELIGLGYDAILRLDNDIEFRTVHWLRKLVAAHRHVGHGAVIAPRVRGLNNPPPAFAAKNIGGMRFSFVDILGGACRLMPTSTIAEFRFNERLPLAMGEAVSLAEWLQERRIPMVYAEDVIVRHMDTTDGQEKAYPEYFERSFLERHIPYGL